MDYVNLTETQAKTLVNAAKTPFMGLDELSLLRVADLLLGMTTAVATGAANTTAITNLNAWATALATKLNADAGVTDVNYDTTPQS